MDDGKKKKVITRREFFEDAAKGALVMGCLAVGVEEAWAEAVKQRVMTQSPIKPGITISKPLLTVNNLNKFYQENWSRPTFDKYVQEAQTNLDTFLNEHFTMTSMQKNYLKSKAGMDKTKINNFINNIAGRTRSFAKSKMGGSPGMIAAQGSGKTCSAGQSWKCWKLDLSTVSFEYCYCS